MNPVAAQPHEGCVYMRVYTTCANCQKSLTVSPIAPAGHKTHQDCGLPGDPLSYLRREYLAAVEREADHGELAELERELDAYDDQPPQLLAAALTYVSWGWPVFPCKPGLKAPMTKHGLRDATTDAEKVAAWWWRTPSANVAVATGGLFDVIDVDPGGVTWWQDVQEREAQQEGVLPHIHGKVHTPRPGGQHIYVEATGRGNLVGFAPGVDYRGLGGYVLLPPSRLTPAAYAKDIPTTRRLHYTWDVYPSPMIKEAA